jgi:hypothetical protein
MGRILQLRSLPMKKKSGLKKLSRTDEDARFPRERGDKFVLGCSAEITASDDHCNGANGVLTRTLEPVRSNFSVWTRDKALFLNRESPAFLPDPRLLFGIYCSE